MTTPFDFTAVRAALCKISRDGDLIHDALLIAHAEHERGRQTSYDVRAVAWCALKRAIRAESRHNHYPLFLDDDFIESDEFVDTLSSRQCSLPLALSCDESAESTEHDVESRLSQCNLSDRQRAIALALARGDSRAQIGESLSISQATISRDVESIASAWRW